MNIRDQPTILEPKTTPPKMTPPKTTSSQQEVPVKDERYADRDQSSSIKQELPAKGKTEGEAYRLF